MLTPQMLCEEPRSTSSHCGSENALDHRVPVLPSVAADAGVPAFSAEEAVAVLLSATLAVPQVAAEALGAVAPRPVTSTDTRSAAKASRLTAARREVGTRLLKLLRNRFLVFTSSLRFSSQLWP